LEENDFEDDNDFIVDDNGMACAYDDEDEEEYETGGKKAKLDTKNPLYTFISKMAVSATNKQEKPKTNLKTKEMSDNIIKDLFSELDNEYEGQTSEKNNNTNNINNFSQINIDSKKHNFSFKNNKTNNVLQNPTKLVNPNFLPEFEKKMTTNNQYSGMKSVNSTPGNNFNGDRKNNFSHNNFINTDDNVEMMEIPLDISMTSDNIKDDRESILRGREIKSVKESLVNDNLFYTNNPSVTKRTREERNAQGNNFSSSKSDVQMTSDNIFQVRTPVTVNKTTTNMVTSDMRTPDMDNRTQYFTPNSRLPEPNIYGRTPMSPNEGMNTPVRSLNNFDVNTNTNLNNSYTNGNINSNTNINYSNSSNISMRQNSIEKLPTNSDGSIKVYWYDAVEDQVQSKPCVIFFGKIFEPSSNTYSSISVVIKNIMRTLYIFPKIKDPNDDSYLNTINKLYEEFDYLRRTKFSYIKNFQCKEIKKKYCFELPINHKEYTILKVKYLADYGTIPTNLQGEHFSYIFGRNSSLLEKIMLSRKLKGPCWLKIKNFEQPTSFNHTWCKYEIVLNDYKQIEVDHETIMTPPLKIMSLSTKTVNNGGVMELFAITAIMKEKYYVEDDKGQNDINNFMPLIVLRKHDQNLNAMSKGINLKVDAYDALKKRYGNTNFLIGQNESAVINQFINRVHQFDPDVIVGHNLYTGHMELLFNRISKLKINNWSKIGKFKRDVLPKFLQNSNLNNIYVRSCMLGRLICDTFVSCRDILRENNYNLSYLSEKHLKDTLDEKDSNLILSNTTQNTIMKDLDDLLENTLKECFLCLGLMDKLAILPLTKQLTNIAGNLWIKSLQNSRADRCEMLLLHEFNKHKFLLPDKIVRGEKLEEFINEDKEEVAATGKKKPQYSGGLVLEPKIGLYDTIVLLLDFNSLYPTIIQEFNICFTTVLRKPSQTFNFLDNKMKNKKNQTSSDDNDAAGNDNADQGLDNELDITNSVIKGKEKAILPTILESLVKKRKIVKDLMKKEKDKFKLSMLEIKQKAIKLSANSLYGYLGYKNSRFYAKSIAALITSTGRSILQETVGMVTTKLNLNVIYGDTDSIMIDTRITDIVKALELGNQVKNNIKEKYRLLEMEIDGVFKTLLLLKKKKYAFLKYEPPYDYNSKLIQEYKGLDLVRRDWCEISKQTGLYLLNIILSDRNKEDIVNLIFDFLKALANKMDNNEYPISDYEITKQLTKNVEDYTDAKALPHVKVAKRLKEKGDMTIKANAFIPYVICINKTDSENVNMVTNENNHKPNSLADRAYHPKEVMENPDTLLLDMNWYKENQILSSVSRLCKHIEEIDMYRLAACLGIDASKYTFAMNKNKDLSEIQNDIRIENDSYVTFSASTGLTITCSKCKCEKKIQTITDKTSNVVNLLRCDSVRINI
jgi:DNA polymerase alpha subunit A